MKVSLRTLSDTANVSIELLKDHTYFDAERCGWHQYLGSQKVGHVATAQALLAFDYWRQAPAQVQAAVATLRGKQVMEPTQTTLHGGWTFVTNGTRVPTVEATCWSLDGLRLSDSGEALQLGIEWLIRNRSVSSHMTAWGATGRDQERIYPTALSVRLLSRFSCGIDAANMGASWLIDHQNTDGGWGPIAGDVSTPVHTAHALLALQVARAKSTRAQVKKGLSFLFSACDRALLWNGGQSTGLREEYEIIANPSGTEMSDGRISFFHMPTPWVVAALSECGEAMSPEAVRGVAWMLTHAEGGGWKHPYLDGELRKPVWAIHDCLYALRCFHSKLLSVGPVERIDSRIRNVKLTMSPRHQWSWKTFFTGWFPTFRNYGLVGCIVALLFGAVGIIPFGSAIISFASAVVLCVIGNWMTPKPPPN